MKNFILLLLISLTLTACARWKIDKPIDEQTEKEHKDHVPPAAINFL